jgi:8-oxo-dGTP diphosphatase
MSENKQPVAAVGTVCFRGDEVLLIRRGAAPFENQWSLPGGRLEWGERARDAALRELREETGCTAEIVGLVDVVDAVMTASAGGEPWGHYLLIDYAARWLAGEPQAGDDAREARFFAPGEIAQLGVWDQTLRIIAAARAML